MYIDYPVSGCLTMNEKQMRFDPTIVKSADERYTAVAHGHWEEHSLNDKVAPLLPSFKTTLGMVLTVPDIQCE